MNRVYCRRRSSDVVRQKINHFASRPLLAKWPSINALVAIWHWRNRWRRLRSCPTHPSRDASLQPFLPSFLLFSSLFLTRALLPWPRIVSMRHVVRRSRDAIDECIRHICRVLRCLRYVGLEEWMSLSWIEIFWKIYFGKIELLEIYNAGSGGVIV